MKNIFITGGAGYVGSVLTPYLLSKNYNVTVFDLFIYGDTLKKHKNLKIIKGDIRDKKSVKKAVTDQEAVIHLAALPFIPDSFYYPGDFFDVNTNGSVNMLWNSIKSRSVEKFVQISTSEVYGSAQTVPMDENHPTTPHSTYAVSKLAGDRATFTLHKENGFPAVIIRPVSYTHLTLPTSDLV